MKWKRARPTFSVVDAVPSPRSHTHSVAEMEPSIEECLACTVLFRSFHERQLCDLANISRQANTVGFILGARYFTGRAQKG